MYTDLTLIVIGAAVVIIVVLLCFLIQGPPFALSLDSDVQNMLDAVKPYKPKCLVDLGSGDGKLVIAFAKQGYRIVGVEINPRLVRRSRARIIQNDVAGKASVIGGSLWKTDTHSYDAVLLYAVPHVMPRLEKKLTQELKPGSIVVSNYFTFPNLKPVRTLGRVHVYEIT